MADEDPIESAPVKALRTFAAKLPGTEVGDSCVNRAFRAGGKAFLYLGDNPHGYKLMLKLVDSLPDAEALQAAQPARYGVGKHGWVTITLPHDERPPRGLFERWIEESDRALAPNAAAARAAKKQKKK